MSLFPAVGSPVSTCTFKLLFSIICVDVAPDTDGANPNGKILVTVASKDPVDLAHGIVAVSCIKTIFVFVAYATELYVNL